MKYHVRSRVTKMRFCVRSRWPFYTSFEATFHLPISMRGQRGTGKIQRNNYPAGALIFKCRYHVSSNIKKIHPFL